MEDEGGSPGSYECVLWTETTTEKPELCACQGLQAIGEAGSGKNWDYYWRFTGTRESSLKSHVWKLGLESHETPWESFKERNDF